MDADIDNGYFKETEEVNISAKIRSSKLLATQKSYSKSTILSKKVGGFRIQFKMKMFLLHNNTRSYLNFQNTDFSAEVLSSVATVVFLGYFFQLKH